MNYYVHLYPQEPLGWWLWRSMKDKISEYVMQYHHSLKDLELHVIVMSGEGFSLFNCFPWGGVLVSVMVKYESQD